MFRTKLIEKIETNILCPRAFFPENFAVYEIMWKSSVQPDRLQITIRRTRIACWITKDTTHSEYVIIIAFALQQWLHERACMLRFTVIDCLVCN